MAQKLVSKPLVRPGVHVGHVEIVCAISDREMILHYSTRSSSTSVVLIDGSVLAAIFYGASYVRHVFPYGSTLSIRSSNACVVKYLETCMFHSLTASLTRQTAL